MCYWYVAKCLCKSFAAKDKSLYHALLLCTRLKVQHLARELKRNILLIMFFFTCKLETNSVAKHTEFTGQLTAAIYYVLGKNWMTPVCQTFLANSVMATPSGCSLFRSAKPTMAVNSWWGHTLSATNSITWVTSGLPWVSVPVLSNTMALIWWL